MWIDTASTSRVVSALSGDDPGARGGAMLNEEGAAFLSSSTSLQQQVLPSSAGAAAHSGGHPAAGGTANGIGAHHGTSFGCHFSPALQACSADPLIKSPLTAASVELGFMSQDPSVAR